MGNNKSNILWKVKGENKYFKADSNTNGTKWSEYYNGIKVSSFELINQIDDTLTLKETDGSILVFNYNMCTINGHYLYSGYWLTNQNNLKPKSQFTCSNGGA